MKTTLLFGMTVIVAALGACGDPTHDDAVTALGPEAPGVRPGPDHRPGQPCLTCHGGSGPGGAQFSIGGTAYAMQGSSSPLQGATVQLTDSRNSTHTTMTNTVGNFYILLSDWAPVAPIGGVTEGDGGLNKDHAIQVCQGPCNPNDTSEAQAYMVTHIGRDGSCADCHYNPPGPLTPGAIYLLAAQ